MDHLMNLHWGRILGVSCIPFNVTHNLENYQHTLLQHRLSGLPDHIWILIRNNSRLFFSLFPRCEININTIVLWDTKKAKKGKKKRNAKHKQPFLLNCIHLFCFSERLSLQIVHCWSLSDFFMLGLSSVIIISAAMQDIIWIKFDHDYFQLWKCQLQLLTKSYWLKTTLPHTISCFQPSLICGCWSYLLMTEKEVNYKNLKLLLKRQELIF